jgi:hypothetical protein
MCLPHGFLPGDWNVIFAIIIFFLGDGAVLEFELRISCFLGRLSSTWACLPCNSDLWLETVGYINQRILCKVWKLRLSCGSANTLGILLIISGCLFFFLVGLKFELRALHLFTKQVFNYLSHTSNPFCSDYWEMGVSWTICLGAGLKPWSSWSQPSG